MFRTLVVYILIYILSPVLFLANSLHAVYTQNLPPAGTFETRELDDGPQELYFVDEDGYLLGGFSPEVGNFHVEYLDDREIHHFTDIEWAHDHFYSAAGSIILMRYEGETSYFAGIDPMRGAFRVTYEDTGRMVLEYDTGVQITGDPEGSYHEVTPETNETVAHGVYVNTGSDFGAELEFRAETLGR